MEKLFNTIKEKIKKNIQVEKIEIIDNTYKHLKHKHHTKNKLHLQIIIESNFLKSLSKVESQRKIMHILNEEIKEIIHSIEIKVI